MCHGPYGFYIRPYGLFLYIASSTWLGRKDRLWWTNLWLLICMCPWVMIVTFHEITCLFRLDMTLRLVWLVYHNINKKNFKKLQHDYVKAFICLCHRTIITLFIKISLGAAKYTNIHRLRNILITSSPPHPPKAGNALVTPQVLWVSIGISARLPHIILHIKQNSPGVLLSLWFILNCFSTFLSAMLQAIFDW